VLGLRVADAIRSRADGTQEDEGTAALRRMASEAGVPGHATMNQGDLLAALWQRAQQGHAG
jgi:hypothetical protein